MPTRRPAPSRSTVQQNGAIKPAAASAAYRLDHPGRRAGKRKRGAAARIDLRATRPAACSAKADPFTEPVVAKDDKKLFRARFAGLDRDQAEAVCRTLKRSDISCITVRN